MSVFEETARIAEKLEEILEDYLLYDVLDTLAGLCEDRGFAETCIDLEQAAQAHYKRVGK